MEVLQDQVDVWSDASDNSYHKDVVVYVDQASQHHGHWRSFMTQLAQCPSQPDHQRNITEKKPQAVLVPSSLAWVCVQKVQVPALLQHAYLHPPEQGLSNIRMSSVYDTVSGAKVMPTISKSTYKPKLLHCPRHQSPGILRTVCSSA
mmetsp:Transcript_1652/g.3078  ORF Transcript_1652/g.3078 Transcript_1652/m.3078 type:complete len:147 (+) Transcript_1652:161-601(+)